MPGARGPDGARPGALCSRTGCERPARWLIVWRNPRIHGPDRHKTWAACDEHLPFLRDFLGARGFPVQVRPAPPGEAPGAGAH